MHAWVHFVTLTVVHAWANYQGVQLLRLNAFNRERLNDVLCHVANSTLHQKMNKESNDDDDQTTKQKNTKRKKTMKETPTQGTTWTD